MTTTDRAPDAGVRRPSPHDARRDARSEAWPSGKAAPCYGVGASSASAGSSPAASVPFRPVAQWKRAVGFEPTCRPFESGRGVSHDRPRVAQLRRAPLLQRGGWGFESLAADMPLKLSSAEQPPCKRKAVGSIPTWGSSSPRSPTWQRHPAQTRTSRGSNPRGGTHDATSFNWQDARLLPGQRWFDPSRRSSFLGRLTAGSSALNRRMRGSNPARGARSYGRGHGVHAVSNTAGEGSIPSVRAPHAPVV